MSFAPAYPVRSARLKIRPLSTADADALVAYRSLPDVCRYVPFSPMTVDDVTARIEGVWSRQSLGQEGEALILGVELADSGEVIGDVMLQWASTEHSCGEIGYVFNPAHAGRGYAAEASHALLHLAFDGLKLYRVIARLDARN